MKKVKKFGRGGDVLTALGAGLAGYGIYKALNKDKDKDDSSGASLKKPTISEEVEKAQDSSKATERKVKDDSSYAPENKFDVAKQTGFTGGGKDDKTKPLPTVIRKKTEAPSKPYPKVTRNFVPNEERASIPYPEKEAAAKKRQSFLSSKAGLSGKGITTPGDPNKKGDTSKGRSANPIQGTIDSAGKSMARTPQQKMAEGAREVERRRQAEKKKKDDEANMKGALKKGGAVKKYASGGSVSSASKRADGIAIRGKTRA